MNDTAIATKRTTVNIGGLTVVLGLLAKIFGWKWNIDANQLAQYGPVIGVAYGVWYRLSRLVTTKVPALGWLLFGSGQEPAGFKNIGAAVVVVPADAPVIPPAQPAG